MVEDDYHLYDLFTIKDYRSITINIPYDYNTSSALRNNDESGCDDPESLKHKKPLLSIQLFHSPAACTDHDLTGQVLWPVSTLLSHYLASRQIDLNGKSVLELGAGGTALPSITASMCGASLVLATDGNDGVVLELLRQNIQNHRHSKQSLSQPNRSQSTGSTLPKLDCRQLLWGHVDHVQTARKENNNKPFDVIVAADVVQWPAVLEPLLHTVHAFMWNETKFGSEKQNDMGESIFVLGIVDRSTAIYQQFLSLAGNMGFNYELIHPREYLEDGIVPATCQENGGRTTKLLKLSLRSSYAIMPLLLSSQQNQDQNYTVGHLFKNTSSLPC